MPCTSTTWPAVSAARPPDSVVSNTVLLVTSTVWPSTCTVPAAVSMVPTGPTTSLPQRMRTASALAVLRFTAPASTWTIMPSFRALLLARLPSSSSTLAALSS